VPMTRPFRSAIAGLLECVLAWPERSRMGVRASLLAAPTLLTAMRRRIALQLRKVSPAKSTARTRRAGSAKCKLGAAACAACSRSVGVLSTLRDRPPRGADSTAFSFQNAYGIN
jgi:hypothetical protein